MLFEFAGLLVNHLLSLFAQLCIALDALYKHKPPPLVLLLAGKSDLHCLALLVAFVPDFEVSFAVAAHTLFDGALSQVRHKASLDAESVFLVGEDGVAHLSVPLDPVRFALDGDAALHLHALEPH